MKLIELICFSILMIMVIIWIIASRYGIHGCFNPNRHKNEIKMSDNINHPKHYNTGKFEVIDVIEDWKLNFHLGNAVKYIARAQYKGNEVEDLKKAIWYIKRYIEGL